MKKYAYFILGNNGSGKSTYRDNKLNLPEFIEIIDADKIEKIANCSSLQAARIAITQFNNCIDNNKSFLMEGTLSDNSMLARIKKAKKNGYIIKAYFLGLDNPTLNVNRVRNRVLKGGHNIPQDVIERRYIRSLENLPKLVPIVDQLKVIDNTKNSKPFIVALNIVRGKIFSDNLQESYWVKNLFDGKFKLLFF